jgi:hypothetical protein
MLPCAGRNTLSYLYKFSQFLEFLQEGDFWGRGGFVPSFQAIVLYRTKGSWGKMGLNYYGKFLQAYAP